MEVTRSEAEAVMSAESARVGVEAGAYECVACGAHPVCHDGDACPVCMEHLELEYLEKCGVDR